MPSVAVKRIGRQAEFDAAFSHVVDECVPLCPALGRHVVEVLIATLGTLLRRPASSSAGRTASGIARSAPLLTLPRALWITAAIGALPTGTARSAAILTLAVLASVPFPFLAAFFPVFPVLLPLFYHFIEVFLAFLRRHGEIIVKPFIHLLCHLLTHWLAQFPVLFRCEFTRFLPVLIHLFLAGSRFSLAEQFLPHFLDLFQLCVAAPEGPHSAAEQQ